MDRPPGAAAQQGVMIIEAMVAILLFALGIVAVLGLQANSIVQVTQAKYRTDASYLADQIIGKMWVDQGTGANLTNYATPGYAGRTSWDTVVANSLPSGAGTIAVVPAPAGGAGGNMVTVTITWRSPEDNLQHQYLTVANINPSVSP